MHKRKIIIAIVLCLTLFSVVNFALAQGGTGGLTTQGELFKGLDQAGGAGGAGLSAKDPRLVVADMVKTFLSILGIIFLVLIVYAGFLWMTSQGEKDKVEKAQGIIKMAVIGLAVVLTAYAITKFVTYWLLVATAP